MDLSEAQIRLSDMLKGCVSARSLKARLTQAAAVCRDFPPDEYSDDYADLLRVPELPYRVKELILRILFVVADEEAVDALALCVRDPTQHREVRTSAAMLLIKLDFDEAHDAVSMGMPELMPLIHNEELNPSGERDPMLAVPEDRSQRFTQAFENVLFSGDD